MKDPLIIFIESWGGGQVPRHKTLVPLATARQELWEPARNSKTTVVRVPAGRTQDVVNADALDPRVTAILMQISLSRIQTTIEKLVSFQARSTC